MAYRTFVEPVRAGAFLRSQGPGDISRDNAVLASGAGACRTGTVLGRVTATGKYVPLDPAAATGAEVASAILFRDVDATSSDVPCGVVARLAEVKADLLVWPAGISPEDKAAAVGQLAVNFIILR